MPTLEIISVNLWQIVISLANLVILFLLMKKFLYKPVRKALAKRNAEIEGRYENAEKAEKEANENKAQWEEKMSTARSEADEMLKNAKVAADRQSDRIISDAKDKADGIVNQAKSDAELEKRKAQNEIKTEIIGVSTLLTEKMLPRSLNEEDHRNLINAFMQEIGDSDDSNK